MHVQRAADDPPLLSCNSQLRLTSAGHHDENSVDHKERPKFSPSSRRPAGPGQANPCFFSYVLYECCHLLVWPLLLNPFFLGTCYLQ